MRSKIRVARYKLGIKDKIPELQDEKSCEIKIQNYEIESEY